MNPGIYISELLFEYDCVIVPGFGGFIGNYAPARIQPASHTFFPPCKSVLFNVNLKQNDGLLAFRISLIEKISYADALKNIEEKVSSWKKELNAGQSIDIDHVGRLYKDPEGNIQFDQDSGINYWQESYGLSSFVSPMIRRQELTEKPERKILHYTETQGKRKQAIPKAMKWAAILALPIGTAAVFGISNLEKIKSLSVSYSGMLISNVAPEPVRNHPVANTKLTVPAIERVEATSTQPVKEEAKVENKISQTEQPVHYAIIVGAFKFLDNAEGLVADLKAKGYDASMEGQTKAGLYRVSLHSFADKEEAFRQLALVRSNEFSSAWLLVK